MEKVVQRYIEETGLTPEGTIQSQYFTALAYFKEMNHYFTLDEIEDPQPNDTYYIRVIGSRLLYQWKGKWILWQEIEDRIYD